MGDKSIDYNLELHLLDIVLVLLDDDTLYLQLPLNYDVSIYLELLLKRPPWSIVFIQSKKGADN